MTQRNFERGSAFLLAMAWLVSGSAWLIAGKPDPVTRPVRLMINWDEQGLWRSQLVTRQKNKQPLDARSVRKVIEASVDEHARAGIDRLAYCAWVRFESPIPGFKTCDFGHRGSTSCTSRVRINSRSCSRDAASTRCSSWSACE